MWRDWGGWGINNFGGTQKLCFLEFESKDKKKVFTTESAKNRSLLTDSGLMISILGSQASNCTPGAPSLLLSLGHNSVFGGHNSCLGRHKQ